MSHHFPCAIHHSRRVVSNVRASTNSGGTRNTNYYRPIATGRVKGARTKGGTTRGVRHSNKSPTSRRGIGVNHTIFHRVTSVFGNDGAGNSNSNYHERLFQLQLGGRVRGRRQRGLRSFFACKHSLSDNGNTIRTMLPRRRTTSVNTRRTGNRASNRGRHVTPGTPLSRGRKWGRQGHGTRRGVFGVNRTYFASHDIENDDTTVSDIDTESAT